MSSDTIFTIGHSTHPIDVLIGMLKAHDIEMLVDIRTIPKSRYNPQYNQEALAESLERHHILYRHMKELGGLRHSHKDSPNIGWRNASFRGYADYMQTPEFKNALDRLIELSRQYRIAMMCSEAVPWRCHRSLVADALTARHISVLHIMSEHNAKPHEMTAFAKVKGTHITYPEPTDEKAPRFL